MKHEEIREIVKRGIKAKRAVFIWGTMGIGKTTIVEDLAKDMKLQMIDVRASQLDPSDVRGIPMPENGRTKWLIPAWLPTEGEGILFLDEFNLATPLVQSAFYQLILSGRLGDYTLPKGWCVVAAGNRIEDRSNVFEMSWALANRFLHAYLEIPDIEDWSKWAADNQVDSRIISFLNYRTELLYRFDVKAKEKSFPTPRTWHFLSDIIKGEENMEMIKSLSTVTIGEGASIEFVAFTKLIKKVDVVELLNGKGSIPHEVDMKYAMISAVADYYKKNTTKEILKKVINLSDKMEPEFKFLLLKMIARSDSKFFLANAPKLKEFEKIKALSDFL